MVYPSHTHGEDRLLHAAVSYLDPQGLGGKSESPGGRFSTRPKVVRAAEGRAGGGSGRGCPPPGLFQPPGPTPRNFLRPDGGVPPPGLRKFFQFQVQNPAL